MSGLFLRPDMAENAAMLWATVCGSTARGVRTYKQQFQQGVSGHVASLYGRLTRPFGAGRVDESPAGVRNHLSRVAPLGRRMQGPWAIGASSCTCQLPLVVGSCGCCLGLANFVVTLNIICRT